MIEMNTIPGKTRTKPSEWQSIETAPKDGTRFIGRKAEIGTLTDSPRRTVGKLYYLKRITWYGKTSHVPLYGWCHGHDPEDVDLWKPSHWKPLSPPK